MTGSGSDPPWAKKEPEPEEVPEDAPSDPAPAPAALVETRAPPEPKKRTKKSYVDTVHESMLEGQSESMIRAWLEKKGLAADRIDHTIERARARIEARMERQLEDDQSAQLEEKRKHLVAGGLWFAGGLVLTLATCSAAEGGGHYVLAWGPMVYGAIRLARGL